MRPTVFTLSLVTELRPSLSQCRHIGFTLVFLPLLDECFLCQIGTTSAALQQHSQGAQCERLLKGGMVHPHPLCMVLNQGSIHWSPTPSCIINPKVLYLTFISVIWTKPKRKKRCFKRWIFFFFFFTPNSVLWGRFYETKLSKSMVPVYLLNIL